MAGKTLYDKLWESHVVREESDGTCLLYIDRHLMHEVTSPQAFEGLRLAGRKAWRNTSIVAVPDHNTPTNRWYRDIEDPISKAKVDTLDANIKEFGALIYFPFKHANQGIIHVIAPENGATLPGMTVVCGDSHTATHGAFAALAHGIGTSEVEHVLATQTLVQKKSKAMLVKIDGNPYHPNNRGESERLAFTRTPTESRQEFGRLCPKGQAGVQTLYDPYRVQHPLRRVGPRGSGRWETITWEQAFTEIAARINALIPFNERLTRDIDPTNLDLGKIANGLVYSPGRSIEKGLSDRIFRFGYGTVNYGIDHTSICETSHHVGNELMTLDHVTGAQGPNLVVKDGTGKVLGKFLGVLPQGITIISVEIDGGSYLYLPSGALYPGFSSSSPSFKNNTCTGPAYVSSSSASSTQFLTGSAGGPTRFVYRPTTPVFGAPFAWQLTTTTEAVVNQPLWQLDSAGACVVDEASFTGTLVTMASVTAPQDVPGPLTIG